MHYAEMLKAWRERFLVGRQRAVALRSEEFARMWEFYLDASEAAFRYQGLVVFQIQLACGIDALPLTRDCIALAEAALAARELAAGPDRRFTGE